MDPGRWLIVVNQGAGVSSGSVCVPSSWEALRGRAVTLADPVHGTAFERTGADLLDGLYIQLDPWGSHLFSIQPAGGGSDHRREP